MSADTQLRDGRLPRPAGGASHKSYQPELSAALMEVQGAVIRECRLDAATMELVRMRCAQVHDCRVCQTVRLEPARAAGVDEDVLAQVSRYESSALSQRHKVILRLVDAHLFGSTPPSLPAEVAEHLSPAEAVDVVLLAAKCSYQKSLVALGLDAPGDYVWFEFDPQTGRNRPLR